MIRKGLKLGVGVWSVLAILLSSCKKNDIPDTGELQPVSGFYELKGNTATPLFKVDGGHPTGFTKISNGDQSFYLLQTMTEVVNNKPGFTAAYSDFPTGVVNNSSTVGALQGSGSEGFSTYDGMVFKKFNASFERGIYRLTVDGTGRVSYDSRAIVTGQQVNGSGNFAYENSTKGYFWDPDKPWTIQLFNPTTMAVTGELGDYEQHLRKSESGITFQAVGQHFLAIKEGKLYADVTYSTGTGLASGMFNDYFEEVYMAVIDLATGNFEKTIVIPETQHIAFINDNEMYSFDTNGDLYILTQGGINDTNGALGGKSKIVRIRQGETDIDSNWELLYSTINASDEGKFTSILAKDGRLVVTANTIPLTPGPTGNINNDEIWKFYTVNVNDNQISEIQGAVQSTNGGGAYPAFVLDDKIILRINAPSQTVQVN